MKDQSLCRHNLGADRMGFCRICGDQIESASKRWKPGYILTYRNRKYGSDAITRMLLRKFSGQIRGSFS